MATDFSISDVLAWARTKPADEQYDFISPGTCALGQYAIEQRGFSERSARIELYAELLSLDLRSAACGDGGENDWTFGKFAARLEKLCPAKSISDTWTKADAYLSDIERVSA